MRSRKLAALAKTLVPPTVHGDDEGDLLVVSWGSTFGSIRSAVTQLQKQGHPVSHTHIRHLNPFPRNLGDILNRFDRILVPEMNLGQLIIVLRGRYGTHDFIPFSKVQGRPFAIKEIVLKIESLLE